MLTAFVQAEKRRLQSKLVNPSPVARKQRDLLVQTQTEVRNSA